MFLKTTQLRSDMRRMAGDTIIEVMIATAILGFVMGAAYALTSRSLVTSRAAQERVEALKLVEGQIEYLKYHARYSANFNTALRDTAATGFCLQPTDGIKISLPETPPAAICKVSGRYQLKINYKKDSSFTDPNKLFGTFDVSATWDRVGSGTDTLTINYQT